jgi:hypothetical protein
MPRAGPGQNGTRVSRTHRRDVLQVANRERDAAAEIGKPAARSARANWPPVPDLFDVITYFRARGDSFTLIASIGFWVGESPTKALTARGLKLWYESELDRRAAAKESIR